MRTIWWKGLVAASAVALVTAGCGSDSGGGSGGSSSGGGDVNIMVLSQLDAPDFAFPEIKDVFTVATDQVNKAGGINGHQINVTYCNDQGNANAAGACARQAVSGKMALVVGPFSLFGSSILPILEAAKIPY